MPATALLTSEQYLALPDEFDKNGNHVKDELIGGEVVRMPPASRVHDLIKNRINRILIRYFDANPYLSLDTLVRGAPELAIEVVSPLVKGRYLKRKVDSYLQGGSRTVLVVNPAARSVLIYSADAVRELKADQKIEDPLLPGFSTPLSAFFELT
jgi:Uma2 family endonuclease